MKISVQTEDIIVRSLKTLLAAFAATLTASGVDVAHLTISKQLAIAALSAGVTAVLNAGLMGHQAIVNQSVKGTITLPPVTPPETPSV